MLSKIGPATLPCLQKEPNTTRGAALVLLVTPNHLTNSTEILHSTFYFDVYKMLCEGEAVIASYRQDAKSHPAVS